MSPSPRVRNVRDKELAAGAHAECRNAPQPERGENLRKTNSVKGDNMLRWKMTFLILLFVASVTGSAHGSQYVEAIGSNSDDYIYCSVETSDGCVVSVGYSEAPPYGGKDMLLMKVDACGGILWTTVIGQSADEEGRCVIETHDGNLVVVGDTKSFGGSGNNLVISKFSSGGVRQWSTVLSKTDAAFEFYSYAVIEDASWNLVITGYMKNHNLSRDELFLSKFNSSGSHLATVSYYASILPAYDHYGHSLVQATDNGDYIVVGSMYHASYGQEILVARFESDLDVVWGWWIAGEGDSGNANKIITLADGGYAITGVAGSKLFYVRLTSALNPDPHGYRRITTGITEGRALVQLSDGAIAVVGDYVVGSVSDVVLTKWNSEGSLSWGRRFGGSGVQNGYAVSEDAFAEITISGNENAGLSEDAWYAKCPSGGLTCLPLHYILSSESWNPDEDVRYLTGLDRTSALQSVSWSPSTGPLTLNDSTNCISPCLIGDADGSGAVDIDDVVYLIAYIFTGGPPPFPEVCCGDADGSGAVDIDDVVYLIAYIFTGGPAPVCTACS